MDPQQLVRLLGASIDASDPTTRRAAEDALQAAARQPGFAPLLAQAALEAGVPPALQQLAAVLLKNTCNRHWQEGERGFEPPQIPDADKARVRELLPAALASPEPRVRTAAGAAVAAVYNFDGDSGWPRLTEALVAAVQARGDANLVAGSLRCLCLMAQDLDEERKPQLLAELSAPLHSIVGGEAPALAADCGGGGGGGGSGGGAPAALVRMALRIMAELVSGLELVESGNDARRRQRAARDAMAPLVGPWVQVIGGVLELPFDAQARHLWSIKLEALRLLQLLVKFFSKHMEGAMPPVMAAAWQMLNQGAALHQALMVEGEEGDDEAAAGGDGLEEGDALRLETVLSQLFELLLTLAGSARHQRLLLSVLPELAALAVTYSQMSGPQEELWGCDANALLADEDADIVGCRPSAEILVDTLLEEFDGPALEAALGAVTRRIAEADEAAAKGAPRWYRLREAALLVLGNMVAAADGAPMRDARVRGEARAILDSLLRRELAPEAVAAAAAAGGGEAGTALLIGRALWLGARLHPLATPEQKQALLQAAAAGVSGALPVAAKVGALRALSHLAPAVPPHALRPLLPRAFAGLLALLGGSSEETMHLVLGTLAALVQVDTEVAAQHVMQLAGPVLEAWSANVADPLVADEGLDVLRALASCPRCLPELARHALPVLAAVIQSPRSQPPMLVEASLNLLEVLTQPSAPDVAAAVCRAALAPAAELLGSTDDASEACAATALLVQLLRAGGPNILNWGPPGSGPDAVRAALAGVASRLLSPQLPDGCSVAAGDLLLAMTKGLGSCPPELVAAAARKLGAGPSPAVVAGLVPFFSRLALADARQLVDLLASTSVDVAAPGGAGGGGGGGQQRQSGLEAALPLLLEAAPDVEGGLATRQVAAALGALLAQRGHPALAALSVRGAPVDGGGGARVTRSAARRQGGLQYTQVPAAAKIVHVLGQLLAAAEEDDAWAAAGLGGLEGASDSDCDSDGGASGGSGGMGSLAVSGRRLGPREGALYGSLAGGGGGGEGEVEADVMARSAAGTPVGEDPEDARDPLARVALRDVVRQALAPVAAQDLGFLQAAAVGMPPDHQQALAALLSGSA
ncbi:MAG: armadillo-type protein [Monoraphidium minutum]|nr:MAG: armadillo-type protein [Monoraphidium minutum]